MLIGDATMVWGASPASLLMIPIEIGVSVFQKSHILDDFGVWLHLDQNHLCLAPT